MSELSGAIEALLFVSDEPLSVTDMANFLGRTAIEVSAELTELAERWQSEERGIQLREVANGWRLYTHPAYHEMIERYVLSWDTRTLSQAALEVLAIIAYHQPATRATVNSIRGVNSEGVVSSLVEKGLVREMGRDQSAGNAILYGTTRVFLEKFGLNNLKDLPPLEDFAPDEEAKEFIRSRLSASAPSEEELEILEDDDLRYADVDEVNADSDVRWQDNAAGMNINDGKSASESEDLEFVD